MGVRRGLHHHRQCHPYRSHRHQCRVRLHRLGLRRRSPSHHRRHPLARAAGVAVERMPGIATAVGVQRAGIIARVTVVASGALPRAWARYDPTDSCEVRQMVQQCCKVLPRRVMMKPGPSLSRLTWRAAQATNYERLDFFANSASLATALICCCSSGVLYTMLF